MLLQKIKKFFAGALFEFSIAGLFLIYLLTYNFLGLPSVSTLIEIITRGFENYGLLFLFVGLLIEGAFMIGFYFPGSVIAFLAVIILGNSPADVFLIVAIGSLSLLLVNFLNYFLGKYGYYKLLNELGARNTIERMAQRFKKNERWAMFIFSSSPNYLAIMSIYAGIANIPIKKYFSRIFVHIIFWVLIVSGILYLFVDALEFSDKSTLGWISFGIMMIWALWEGFSSLRKKIS